MYDLYGNIHSLFAVVGKRPPEGKRAPDHLLDRRPPFGVGRHERCRALVEDAVDHIRKVEPANPYLFPRKFWGFQHWAWEPKLLLPLLLSTQSFLER